jgi:hypothetical protein
MGQAKRMDIPTLQAYHWMFHLAARIKAVL